MLSLHHYIAPPSQCGYLPQQLWRLEYEVVADLSADDYLARIRTGWRRFGSVLFRPRCKSCQACQTLRIDVGQFRPNRSQRRVMQLNRGAVEIRQGVPAVSRARLNLYDRYHAQQAQLKGWPEHPPRDAESYRDSFVHNPSFTEEWCYYLDGRLVGVGYVDALPGCLSAIYFYYDPDERRRSLGTWNVLSVIEEARRRSHRHVYLGYFVAGCPSLAYKAAFRPNEILLPDGSWVPFRT